jgi:hypothetical protein
MTYWFDPSTNFNYRASFEGDGWHIWNKEPSEAKWYKSEVSAALVKEAEKHAAANENRRLVRSDI